MLRGGRLPGDEAPNGKRAMEQLALGSLTVLTDLMMPDD
jgi:hypothetical protein